MDRSTVKVGARESPLSKAQIEEVRQALPEISLETEFVKTIGDRELSVSLRHQEKTDFFTRELDEMLLQGQCDITVHSAKDLPDPLPQGLKMVALTKGVDTRDSLVMREGQTVAGLPPGSVVGTSTLRREGAVNLLREDLTFREVRGTVGERLQLLAKGEIDCLVVAEAALIRLRLTHLNRIFLEGEAAPLQGKLAILAREGDSKMESLFGRVDIRRTKLYLGLRAPEQSDILHYPIIRTFSLPHTPCDLSSYTHLIFTSKTAVEIFLSSFSAVKKVCLAIGPATAKAVQEGGLGEPLVAKEATAEGMVALLESLDLSESNLFWPHSDLARPVIANYLRKAHVKFTALPLYTTEPQIPYPLPDLSHIQEVIFTSPSTVEPFFALNPSLKPETQFSPIGPITGSHLQNFLEVR